jgi:hypothetical protein
VALDLGLPRMHFRFDQITHERHDNASPWCHSTPSNSLRWCRSEHNQFRLVSATDFTWKRFEPDPVQRFGK